MVIVGRVLLVMGTSCLCYAASATVEAENRSDTEAALLETSFEAFGSAPRDWSCSSSLSTWPFVHQSELASEVGLFDFVKRSIGLSGYGVYERHPGLHARANQYEK